MKDPSELAAALADATRKIDAAHSVQETLDEIVHAARVSVPGFQHAGISTIARRGRVDTRASTDSVVILLDNLQREFNEGPCMDALRESTVVSVPGIRHDQRWPRYVRAAVDQANLKSQLALRLFLAEDRLLGSLNLYSTENEDIDEDAAEIAELFAVHAAVALGHAHEVDHFSQALQTNRLIAQATGIIMERHKMSQERAFAYLSRVSQDSNIKLRDVAQEVIDHLKAKR